MIQDNHLGDDRSTNVLLSTELTGSSDNNENIYSGDYNFESWLGQLGQLRFSVLLLSPSNNMPEQYTKSGSDYFLLHHSQFIIHDHLMVHSIITDTSLK